MQAPAALTPSTLHCTSSFTSGRCATLLGSLFHLTELFGFLSRLRCHVDARRSTIHSACTAVCSVPSSPQFGNCCPLLLPISNRLAFRTSPNRPFQHGCGTVLWFPEGATCPVPHPGSLTPPPPPQSAHASSLPFDHPFVTRSLETLVPLPRSP